MKGTGRQCKYVVVWYVTLMLGACATYRPEPLGDGHDALQGPDIAQLVQSAAVTQRPFLNPVSVDLSRPLSSDAIAVLAVVANPDLRAMREREGVAEAQAFAARLLPDPTFSAGIDYVLSGPDPLNAIAAALGLDLSALRARGATVDKARSEANQARLDLAWAEWQTAGQARIQAVRRSSLQALGELLAASSAAQNSLLQRSLKAAARGDLAADLLLAARASAFDVAERGRANARELQTASGELLRLLGVPPATTLELSPMPLQQPPPSADRLFGIALANRADLAALRAGYEAQESAVRKAVLDQFPGLNLTINAQRDSSGNRLLGPAIDFTLPLWNRNRGGIAIERATRAAVKAEYNARVFQARAEIAAAAEGIALAERERAAVTAELPALERVSAASTRAAERGDIAPAVAEAARQALRDEQIQLLQAEQDLREQAIALELLTGAPRRAWNL